MEKLDFMSLVVSWKSLLFIAMCITFAAAQSSSTSKIACNFDRGWCGWKNVFQGSNLDDFNWKLGSRSDGKQKGSGGDRDHNGGGGYAYIKSKNKRNRTALLRSPTVNIQGQSCFQFWYLMKGRTLGHLEVLISTKTGNKVPIWNLRGHQGDKWLNAKIPMSNTNVATFWFEAFDWEEGKSGNILVDQVTLTKTGSTPCTLTPSYAAIVDTQTKALTTNEPVITTAYMVTSLLTKFNAAITLAKATSGKATTPAVSGVTLSAVTSGIPKNKTMSLTVTSSNSRADNSTINAANATNLNISTTNKQVVVAKPTQLSKTWIAIIVLIVLACLVVALLFYFRQRKKHRMTYVDESSVVMTRMYPDITSEPRVEYSKLT